MFILPNVIRTWNTLDQSVKNGNNLNEYKKQIKREHDDEKKLALNPCKHEDA